jgi:hypothetical protein
MGKADKQAAQQGIQKGQQTSDTNYGSTIGDIGSRLYGAADPITGQRGGGIIQQGQQERQNLLGGYGDLARTGGLQEGEYGALMSGDYGRGYNQNYLNTYNDLAGSEGGFNPSRLGNISQASNYLRGLPASGAYSDVNQGISGLLGQGQAGAYGDVNQSISGLEDIGRTGGVSDSDISNIQRPIFSEFEKTGGYSPEDISNIRGRSAAGAASTYSNLRDSIERNRLASGQAGPGFSEAGLRLARQSAQDVGSNAANTELGISNAVREGRMNAANTLSQNQLALSRLQSGNRLQAYGQAGNLGIQKQQAMQDAMARAASLGLSRQEQLNEAQKAAAGIDLQTQGLVNQGRIAGAQGLQTAEERQRQLDAENQRFLIGQRTAGQQAGLGGLLSAYGTTSGPESFYQNLMRSYIGGQTGADLGWNQQRINVGSMPGLGSSILGGVGAAGSLLGGFGGLLGGLGGGPSYGQNTGVGTSPPNDAIWQDYLNTVYGNAPGSTYGGGGMGSGGGEGSGNIRF